MRSSTRLSSQARLMRPVSASVRSAEPTFTTTRRAPARGEEDAGRGMVMGKLYAKLAAANPEEAKAVSRDYEPVPGQWYEKLVEDETLRVLTLDEDSELLEGKYLEGEIEEIDLETWHEMEV